MSDKNFFWLLIKLVKINKEIILKKYLKVLPDQKPLSLREKEVVGYAIKGLADSNIADKLSISISTVKFHLKNIYKKLGINNRKGFLKIYCIDWFPYSHQLFSRKLISINFATVTEWIGELLGFIRMKKISGWQN